MALHCDIFSNLVLRIELRGTPIQASPFTLYTQLAYAYYDDH